MKFTQLELAEIRTELEPKLKEMKCPYCGCAEHDFLDTRFNLPSYSYDGDFLEDQVELQTCVAYQCKKCKHLALFSVSKP